MKAGDTKHKTQAQYKKILWRVFSEYIRKRDKGVCITCGKRSDWRNCDAGHYIPKSVCGIELCFHPQNVHAQCRACNYYRRGNLSLYALALQNKYGKNILERLEAQRKLSRGAKWSVKDFEEKIKKYSEE